MFSRAAANELRELLSPLNLGAAPGTSELIASYRDHYSLIFDSDFTHRIGVFESEGFQLVAQHFQVPAERCRGTAFLLHGYYDHGGLYGHLIRHLLHENLSVLIFDLPGHGLSSGEPASIDSFQRYCSAFLALCQLPTVIDLPRPWFAIGQSTGSAVLMDSLLHNDLANRVEFKKLVLLCPLIYPAQWGKSKFLYYLASPFLDSVKRGFARNSHDEEFLDFLKHEDALQCRVLPTAWVGAMIDYHKRFQSSPERDFILNVVQGTEDGTVDWRKNLPLIEMKFKGTKSYLIEGARHHMVNESEDYRGTIFNQVSRILFE
jgi:alpha-beta hydrolase superfamily lysophospholipase